jgi:hypothetical protein
MINVQRKRPLQAIKYTGYNFDEIKKFIDNNWYYLDAHSHGDGNVKIYEGNSLIRPISINEIIVSEPALTVLSEEQFEERYNIID